MKSLLSIKQLHRKCPSVHLAELHEEDASAAISHPLHRLLEPSMHCTMYRAIWQELTELDNVDSACCNICQQFECFPCQCNMHSSPYYAFCLVLCTVYRVGIMHATECLLTGTRRHTVTARTHATKTNPGCGTEYEKSALNAINCVCRILSQLVILSVPVRKAKTQPVLMQNKSSLSL